MSSKTPTGNLNFGIPYRKTPPICDLFSNIVTLYPFLANIKANDIPAGPEPIIAILSFNLFSCFYLVFFKYSLDIKLSIS